MIGRSRDRTASTAGVVAERVFAGVAFDFAGRHRGLEVHRVAGDKRTARLAHDRPRDKIQNGNRERRTAWEEAQLEAPEVLFRSLFAWVVASSSPR
jgi:hypothetical protein